MAKDLDFWIGRPWKQGSIWHESAKNYLIYRMSLHAPSSPALLLVEADSVRALVVHGVDAATPFRLDVRDAGEASVTDSTFRSVEGSIHIVVRKLAVVGNFHRLNL